MIEVLKVNEVLNLKAEQFRQNYDLWQQEYFKNQSKKPSIVNESLAYSLKSGGKRFRPFLASLVFEIWSSDLSTIKNFCIALEMVHTYSLIHDDLPCMDNDDFRRGMATNHKVFGEDIALLAGDGLLTEAFYLIASDKTITSNVRIQLVELLSDKIGPRGMVAGQALDMKLLGRPTESELEDIHILKTGYLIQAAAVGAALLANVNAQQVKLIEQFSLNLGLSFQIKDDLLDADEKDQSNRNYISILGKPKTENLLQVKSELAKKFIKELNLNTKNLEELIEFNIYRES